MDDRVRDLMYRVKKTATAVGETAESAARYAGRRAGEMVDVTKLNMKIYDLKAEINSLLKDVGQVVYDAHTGTAPAEDKVDDLLKKIDARSAAIADCKDRIAMLRNLRDCPFCGAACGRMDKFCKECGHPL